MFRILHSHRQAAEVPNQIQLVV